MPLCVYTEQELRTDESKKFITSSLRRRVMTQCYSTISDPHMKPNRTLRSTVVTHLQSC